MGNNQVNLEQGQIHTDILREGTDTQSAGHTDSEEMIWQMVQKASVPPEQIMDLVKKKQPKPKKGQATIYELLGE